MKKLFLILSLFLLFCMTAFGAENDKALINDYNDYVKRTVAENIHYKGKSDISAEICFTIHRDGTVENVKIIHSGNPDIDKKLIDAVNKSAPFKSFPQDVKYSKIDISINYNYNYDSSGYYNDNTSDFLYKEYYYKIRTLVYKQFPVSYSWITDSIVFEITILPDGSVKNVNILESSGSKRYDNNVIKKLMAYKFPYFPANLNENELNFTFDINKNTRIYPPVIIPVRW